MVLGAGRGQLDGERHAVQGPGDPADGDDVGLVEDGPRASRAGTLHEQLRGRIGEDLLRTGASSGGASSGPTLTWTSSGTASASRLVARIGDVGAATEDVVGQSRGCVDDVLAVVEKQQQLPVGEVAVEPLADVTFGGGAVHRHAERVRDRDGNLIGGVQRRQSHPEDTIREVPAAHERRE